MPVMLVTGASGHLGGAVARAAAERGWDLGLSYCSRPKEAHAVAEQLRTGGRRVDVRRLDVRDEAAVIAYVAGIASDLGPIDCLVNNAGVAPGYGAFTDLRAEDLDHVLAVNVRGAFLCAREAVRVMARSRGGSGGSIVNVSSKAAVLGGPGEWIHYAASKGAMDTMTAGLAAEFADDGIRVNSVRVGLVAEDFGPWAPPGRLERLRTGIPMGRAGELGEFAAAITWLASAEASYVTGAVLDVTGGR